MSHSFLVSYAYNRFFLPCYPLPSYLFTVSTSYSILTIWTSFFKLKTTLLFSRMQCLFFKQSHFKLIFFFSGRNMIVQFERNVCVHKLFTCNYFIVCSVSVYGASSKVCHSQILILFSAVHFSSHIHSNPFQKSGT